MFINIKIPEEEIIKAGYFKSTDKETLKRLGLVRVEDLEPVRLTIRGIANYLNVGYSRVWRYLKHRDIRLDPDGKLSLKEVERIDWSELTDLDKTGDNKRKKTFFKF